MMQMGRLTRCRHRRACNLQTRHLPRVRSCSNCNAASVQLPEQPCDLLQFRIDAPANQWCYCCNCSCNPCQLHAHTRLHACLPTIYRSHSYGGAAFVRGATATRKEPEGSAQQARGACMRVGRRRGQEENPPEGENGQECVANRSAATGRLEWRGMLQVTAMWRSKTGQNPVCPIEKMCVCVCVVESKSAQRVPCSNTCIVPPPWVLNSRGRSHRHRRTAAPQPAIFAHADGTRSRAQRGRQRAAAAHAGRGNSYTQACVSMCLRVSGSWPGGTAGRAEGKRTAHCARRPPGHAATCASLL